MEEGQERCRQEKERSIEVGPRLESRKTPPCHLEDTEGV